MTIGEHVLLRKSNYSGTIAFIGTIDFASGVWIGVELDAPVGNNIYLNFDKHTMNTSATHVKY